MHFRIQSITSTCGQRVDLARSGVTCIVGANNAGKSQLLRDIRQLAQDNDSPSVVISELTFEWQAPDSDQFESILMKNSRLERQPTGEMMYFFSNGNAVSLEDFPMYFSDVPHRGLGHVVDAFMTKISAGELASFAVGEMRTEYDPERIKNVLLGRVYSDPELERKISDLVESFFSLPLFMDHHNFPPRLRVGKSAHQAERMKTSSRESWQDMHQPTLDDQGDGFKAFVGLALVLLARTPEVLLLDEPESFLHPGQARAVGRWLAEVAQALQIQVIVATHDKDFLSGLMHAEQSETSVIRVSRDKDESRFTHLDAQQLQTYWRDPVLRFSTVLQGLFHERVVIAEADTDCRFYSAVAEASAEQSRKQTVVDNTLFVPAGGKTEIPKFLGVLTSLGVSARVICDIDVLRNKRDVSRIVAKLGSRWDADWDQLFQNTENHTFAGAKEFWDSAKKRGIQGVPEQVTRDFEALFQRLRDIHFHVLPQGEMETFYPARSKGPGWITAALENNAHSSPQAEDFIHSVLPELSQTA